MRDKYGVAHDKYCYPNSDVLKNLLDIQDSSTLDEAEAEFTAELTCHCLIFYDSCDKKSAA